MDNYTIHRDFSKRKFVFSVFSAFKNPVQRDAGNTKNAERRMINTYLFFGPSELSNVSPELKRS